MKIKKKEFFILSLVLFNLLIYYTVNVFANDYKVGLEEDSIFFYEIKTLDEEAVLDLLRKDDIEEVLGDEAEVGAFIKLEIADIDDTFLYSQDPHNLGNLVDGWLIEFDVWEWEDDRDHLVGKEDWEMERAQYEEPDDLGRDFNDVPFWIPSPVQDFISEIDWDKDVEIIDALSLTMQVEEDDYLRVFLAGYFNISESVEVFFSYTDQGILSNYKIEQDGEIFMEIVLDQPIWPYLLIFSIILVVTLAGILGIIKMRQRKDTNTSKIKSLSENLRPTTEPVASPVNQPIDEDSIIKYCPYCGSNVERGVSLCEICKRDVNN